MKPLNKGVFITATDTEVGKTFFASLLMRSMLQQGISVGYFKPVASGCRLEAGSLVSEDLLFIQKFTGIKLEHDLHCPIRYQKPLAPLAAARLEKRPVNIKKIWEALEQVQKKYGCLVVEGVGGVMVPLKENYLVLDLVADIRLPAVIVCRPGLGTINHTLLTLSVLKSRRISIAGFLTNGFRKEDDEAALTSPDIITAISRVPYLGHIPEYNPRREDLGEFLDRKAKFIQDITASLKAALKRKRLYR